MSFPINSDQFEVVCNQFNSRISKCVLLSSSKSYLKNGIKVNLSFPLVNSYVISGFEVARDHESKLIDLGKTETLISTSMIDYGNAKRASKSDWSIEYDLKTGKTLEEIFGLD